MLFFVIIFVTNGTYVHHTSIAYHRTIIIHFTLKRIDKDINIYVKSVENFKILANHKTHRKIETDRRMTNMIDHRSFYRYYSKMNSSIEDEFDTVHDRNVLSYHVIRKYLRMMMERPQRDQYDRRDKLRTDQFVFWILFFLSNHFLILIINELHAKIKWFR